VCSDRCRVVTSRPTQEWLRIRDSIPVGRQYCRHDDSRLLGNVLSTATTALVAELLLVPIAFAEPGPVIALPAADAEALELLGKYTETDVEMSYVTHFHPGILLAPGLAPGKAFEAKQKALVYKIGHPDKTAYTGSMDVKLTYVGAYEVTTPAGKFPSVLMRAEFDIKVGPAVVKDVQYSFFGKGVGKVAEIEALKVSALLIYHSNDKTAKVLAKKPKR
jgi:hypothetical protein